ncbi:PglL family O-oligosaccharyltransferase [Acinetobacter sp. GXMZU3951]
MKFILSLLASVLIALAWLLPVHYRPWVTYTGELFAFLSLFTLVAIFLQQKIKLPMVTLPLVVMAFIPVVQWMFGLEFFFSVALISCLFVIGFWLSTVLGYNLSLTQTDREQAFTVFSYVLLIVGTLSGLMAIAQWLTIENHIPGIANLRSNRPYANFAQPNNMATFLILSLMSSLYLFEKSKVKAWALSLCSLVILVALVLSQSRTSWVVCILFLGYFFYQQYRGYLRLKWYAMLTWVGLFIGLILALPIADHWIAQASHLAIADSPTAIERASSGHLRLGIWQQMLYAISDRPWFGYGWNQTSVAQVSVSEYYRIPEWVRSSHNFVLDFLVWNGLLIGVPFLAYLMYLAYRLISRVNSTESVIGTLMVIAVLVHALLEYPQNYAYFLLPLGFIVGLVLSQDNQLKVWTLAPKYMQIMFIVGGLLLVLIHRDYMVAVPKLNQSMRYEKTPEKITNHDRIYVLDELSRRIAWIRLNPNTLLSKAELQQIYEMVQCYPTKYDLLKYARVLAFNGDEQGARHQLWLLKQLKHVDVSYESLLAPTQ